ncbi:MAG: TerB family tellurite resistance protein [Candidatus Cloacimonetes bacterium]|nr:TerB family tellurite resistance protein [Candidatus Cloacimonadota bacterium]
MRPKDGFIALCYILAKVDQVLVPEETLTILDELHRYGFDREDIRRVHTKFDNLNPELAMSYGVIAMSAATQLDEASKRSLITALQHVARADGRVDNSEVELLKNIKVALNIE